MRTENRTPVSPADPAEDLLPLPEADLTAHADPARETTVYYTDISELQDLAGLDLLTPERRERTLRFRQHDDQVRSLAAGLLERRFVHPGEPLTGPHGKPYFPDGPQFNLSHSGQYVVLAVSIRDVGLDIEQMKPWSAAVAERCFVAPERDWLYRQPDLYRAFFSLWTAKESIMKATGAGFHMPPETIRIFPAELTGTDANGTDWYLQWLSLPDHVVCLATPDPEPAVRLQLADRTDLLR